MIDLTSVTANNSFAIISKNKFTATLSALPVFYWRIMIEYKTILDFAQDQFTEKKSRFIGYANPVSSVVEAMNFVAEIKSRHKDATHNVFAYVIRDGNGERYSDDGEPQGTAGIPVLDVIKKENLTDCVVVVTRYFGGTMLGAGGLVRAYSHASKIALNASRIVTVQECAVCQIICDYNFYGRLNTYLSECSAEICDTNFSENVVVDFYIPAEKYKEINLKIIDMSNGNCSLKIIKKVFHYIKK